MFLKHVKNLLAKKQSIALQLTLFYSLSTLILVTIISLFLYYSMISVLYSADHQFLLDEINIVKNILKTKPNNSLALKQEVTDIPHSLKPSVYHYYIRILSKNHKVITETTGFNKVMQGNIFFNEKIEIKRNKWWKSITGKYYLLKQSLLNANKIDAPWLMQIALDVTYQQKTIDDYRRNVIFAIFIGAFFSIILGYFLSYRGIRRLYQLTEATKKITAHDLHQRIDPQHWPKELNELALAFNQMLERIEIAFSKLKTFSDDLAHELRMPITNLMGETELILSRTSSLDQYHRVLESNLEELNRIYQIVENLLFLARTENPQFDLQKELVYIDKEIHSLYQFYQVLADEKNIELSYSGTATVFANRLMFRRMISNILANAINYTNNHGSVKFIFKETNKKFIQIILMDTGIGIPTEHLSKIFDRLYRGDNARAIKSEGIGLGLTIVKSIIDLHQGIINVTSILNKGTIIDILLPK